MSALEAKYTATFARDLKRLARKRNRDVHELDEVIDLVLENTPEALEKLRRRHRMHTLTGAWAGHRECHVANMGDWLLIWSSDESFAYFERTGTHDELFR